MIERVKDYILSNGLVHSNEKVLVGISGGVDSMTLLFILAKLGYDVSAAHMNYQLRGEASDLDEQLVEEVCAKMKIQLFKRKVELRGHSSTQIEARNLRYGWFKEIAERHGHSKIATAHHLNDSLETILLNLSKGTGIAGVSGIRPKHDMIIRPFLNQTRSQILEYAKKENVKWREDESNSNSKYQRNRIRNQVIPQLELINPSIIETFRSTHERLSATRKLVEIEVDKLKSNYLKVEGAIELNIEWLANDVDLMLLSEILKEYGVSYSLSKEIFECTESGKKFISPSHTIHRDRGRLIIKPTNDRFHTPLTIQGYGSYTWGQVDLVVSAIDIEDVDKSFPDNVAYLDSERVQFPLSVRSWIEGDEFKPYGMKGKKKLSDFFIDKKIPVSSKNDIPILESDGRIVWVGGYRIDDRYRLRNETQRVIMIEMT